MLVSNSHVYKAFICFWKEGVGYVRNHDSLQWYDIIHFEHKLPYFAFSFPKKPHVDEDVFLVNPWSFPKLANVGLTPNNPQQVIVSLDPNHKSNPASKSDLDK